MEDKIPTDVPTRGPSIEVPDWLYQHWIRPQANRRNMTPDVFVEHVLRRMYAQILHEAVPAARVPDQDGSCSYRWIELTSTQQTHN